MPRVLMNFQQYKDWVVYFIEADCKTTIGRRTRYFHSRMRLSFEPSLAGATLKTLPSSRNA